MDVKTTISFMILEAYFTYNVSEIYEFFLTA